MDGLGASRYTRDALEAVLWILNTGPQWHMLPQSYPNYKNVHRRFQSWCCNEILRRVLTDIAHELHDRGALDQEECFIDATFVMAKGGWSEVGTTKRGKGMKIMAIVDRHGLPLSVSTHAANHREVRLVQLCFDFYMIEAKPENLIGDRAYDSDPLDEELRNDSIEMIAPHRCNRTKLQTQDRRRLSRYMRRWLVGQRSRGRVGQLLPGRQLQSCLQRGARLSGNEDPHSPDATQAAAKDQHRMVEME
jgi:transposase